VKSSIYIVTTQNKSIKKAPIYLNPLIQINKFSFFKCGWIGHWPIWRNLYHIFGIPNYWRIFKSYFLESSQCQIYSSRSSNYIPVYYKFNIIITYTSKYCKPFSGRKGGFGPTNFVGFNFPIYIFHPFCYYVHIVY